MNPNPSCLLNPPPSCERPPPSVYFGADHREKHYLRCYWLLPRKKDDPGADAFVRCCLERPHAPPSLLYFGPPARIKRRQPPPPLSVPFPSVREKNRVRETVSNVFVCVECVCCDHVCVLRECVCVPTPMLLLLFLLLCSPEKRENTRGRERLRFRERCGFEDGCHRRPPSCRRRLPPPACQPPPFWPPRTLHDYTVAGESWYMVDNAILHECWKP